MILRRLTTALRKQDWFTVVIETLIVMFGVFLGLQVNNWNEANEAKSRREQIKAAIITDLRDASEVQRNGIAAPVRQGLSDWQAAFDRGERPAPFFFRITGSDTPPDTWAMLQKEQLTKLFDPQTVFDLGFYYSELQGTGRKYVRYVTFVESEILPKLKGDPMAFYVEDGSALKPEYAANMDRISEYADEVEELSLWTDCLIYRIEAKRSFETLCRRNGYRLDGMPPRATTP